MKKTQKKLTLSSVKVNNSFFNRYLFSTLYFPVKNSIILSVPRKHVSRFRQIETDTYLFLISDGLRVF